MRGGKHMSLIVHELITNKNYSFNFNSVFPKSLKLSEKAIEGV